MFPSSDSGGSHFNSGLFFHASHANNQQDSHWGGYTPSPLSPGLPTGLPMPLPEDPCADSITHLQRLPQVKYSFRLFLTLIIVFLGRIYAAYAGESTNSGLARTLQVVRAENSQID